jgi:hypothetical protein
MSRRNGVRLLSGVFTHRRRTAALILVIAGTLVAGSSSAAWAYDPNDPYDSGCATGAYAVGSSYIAKGSPNKTGATGFGSLHLMYSPKCHTNWAEFDNYPKGYSFILGAWSDPSPVQNVDWTSNGDEVAWTDMVDGSGPANVGVCEYSSNWSTVLRQAYLMQDGGDTFTCVLEGFVIGW